MKVEVVDEPDCAERYERGEKNAEDDETFNP
jgi:hypothetical protein